MNITSVLSTFFFQKIINIINISPVGIKNGLKRW